MSDTTRRRVLTSMLAAPVLAGLAPVLRAAGEDDRLIASAAEALDILQSELAGNMRQAGTRSLAEINASHIVERRGV